MTISVPPPAPAGGSPPPSTHRFSGSPAGNRSGPQRVSDQNASTGGEAHPAGVAPVQGAESGVEPADRVRRVRGEVGAEAVQADAGAGEAAGAEGSLPLPPLVGRLGDAQGADVQAVEGEPRSVPHRRRSRSPGTTPHAASQAICGMSVRRHHQRPPADRRLVGRSHGPERAGCGASGQGSVAAAAVTRALRRVHRILFITPSLRCVTVREDAASRNVTGAAKTPAPCTRAGRRMVSPELGVPGCCGVPVLSAEQRPCSTSRPRRSVARPNPASRWTPAARGHIHARLL